MIGFDSPSFDGEWNQEQRTQTWYSPSELYDRENRCNDVVWSGYNWQYTLDLNQITNFESRWRFKSDDLWAQH